MEKTYEFWQKCVKEWEKENGEIDDNDKEIKSLLYTIKKAYEKGKNDKTDEVYRFGH